MKKLKKTIKCILWNKVNIMSELTQEEYSLISAVMNGSLSSVKKYISKCDMKKIGILALRQSLGWQDLEIAQFLIKKGAPAHTVLMHSVNDGTMFEIERILSINQFSTQELTQACAIGLIKDQKQALSLLFKQDPQIRQHENYLLKIAQQNNPSIIGFLKENEYVSSNQISSDYLKLMKQNYLNNVNKTTYKH